MKESINRVNSDFLMVTRFPEIHQDGDIDTNAYLFKRDISLAIMPIGGRTARRKNFSVEIQGDSLDCIKAEKIVGKLNRSRGYNLTETVCDTINDIASSLSVNGRVTHEILKDDEQISIRWFTSVNLFRVWKWYIQIVPRKDWYKQKRYFTLVRKHKVWRIDIPYKLGGVRGYRKTLNKFSMSSSYGPKFYTEDMEFGTGRHNYNFNVDKYFSSTDMYLNKITQKWGWNRSDLSIEHCNEFYVFYKILSLNYAKAVLREHIIGEINTLFAMLSINCELIVTGLPTAEEILGLRNDMCEGNISFADASNRSDVS